MKNSSRIVHIEDAGKKCLNIFLEPSNFHPSGGGQPGDSGVIFSDSFEGRILDTLNMAEGKAHVTKVRKGNPLVGDEVVIEVDEERHKVLTQMHSAQHIISRILENRFPDLLTKKANVTEDETSVYFSYTGDFNWEMLFDTEDYVNQIIGEKRSVTASSVSVEEARCIDGLIIKWDRIPPNEQIRVVTIKDFDVVACSGTHVQNTSEIPSIFITSFKGSSPDWEIKFSLSRKELLNKYSRIVRTFSRNTGCPPEKLEKTYVKIQDENREYRKTIEKLRQYLELPWERDELGEYSLYYANLPGLDKDMVFPAAKKMTQKDPHALVLVIMPDENLARSSFLLLQGSEGKLDLRSIIKKGELKARGGGEKGFVSGITECNSFNLWKAAIKDN